MAPNKPIDRIPCAPQPRGEMRFRTVISVILTIQVTAALMSGPAHIAFFHSGENTAEGSDAVVAAQTLTLHKSCQLCELHSFENILAPATEIVQTMPADAELTVAASSLFSSYLLRFSYNCRAPPV